MSEASLPPEAADLYGLPLDEFTPARNQLVKELKAAKRKDEAASVGQLRKPPATAWALNQLARTSPHLVEDVVGAAAQLKAAMDQAISGDRSSLVEAQAGERRAVNSALEAAVALLTGAGSAAPDAARRKMAESLRGATLDPVALEFLRAGVLTDDVAATSLGFDLAAAPDPRSVPGPTPRPVPSSSHPARPALAAVPDASVTKESADPAEDGAGESPNETTRPTEPASAAAESTESTPAATTGADDEQPPMAPSTSAIEARADELSQRRQAKKRHELQEELTVLRQRAARLAEQVTDAEAGLVELRKRATKAADAVTDTEAELAELPPPPED